MDGRIYNLKLKKIKNYVYYIDFLYFFREILSKLKEI